MSAHQGTINDVVHFKGHLALWTLFAAVFNSSSAEHSIARVWNEEILAAIRIDLPHPPVHARNLFHLSVAMYDAWAAYDPVAAGYLYREKHSAPDLETAPREAVSYAAYRILTNRYILSRNAERTLQVLSSRMTALGLDPTNTTTDPNTGAGVGNRVAAAVIHFAASDGSLQERAYRDLPANQGGYVPKNAPLLTMARGTLAVDPNRWQPLAFTNAISQNNIPVELTQHFLGPQWLQVRPFALSRSDPAKPWIDPGPPPRLGGLGDAQYRSEAVEIVRRSRELSADDGVTIDISPGAFGNSSLGTNDGKGRPVNPATGQPYASNPVNRGDFARVLAEYWADGPNSETPPGHWNSIANQVSDTAGFVKRIGGTGPPLSDLEWDVKLYFALNAALHDAACAAWSLKRYYDGPRPIHMIRYMGQRGQSTDPTHPTYTADGLPLEPGLIEIVSFESSRPGGRHAGLAVGTIALYVWPGPPENPKTDYSKLKWIAAADWLPYQKRTFVTPAFPGYVSGHSTFSRAAAEIMTSFTGSKFFAGGLATHTVQADTGLTVERGPSQAIQLQWATYYDAADQAGLSRLWGGIHVPADDLTGRKIGSQCGKQVWDLARRYFDGSILQVPALLSIVQLPGGGCEVQVEALRGFTYFLQSTADLSRPLARTADLPILAGDTKIAWRTPGIHHVEFFRVQRQ